MPLQYGGVARYQETGDSSFKGPSSIGRGLSLLELSVLETALKGWRSGAWQAANGMERHLMKEKDKNDYKLPLS